MKKQNLILSAALVAVFSASTAFAEAEVTGKIVHESGFFSEAGSTIGDYGVGFTNAAGSHDGGLNTHKKNDAMKRETSARIYVDGELNEVTDGATYHVELNLMTDGKGNSNYDSHESYTQRDALREAYVDTTVEDWSIRAGKQQVVWGTADGMKLLDMINPTDYSEMAQNQMEDSRIPVWMVNAEKTNEDGSEFQVIVSQPRENIFAGLNRHIDTSVRRNSATTGADGTHNLGADTGHAFIMKGPDTITGVENGFLNIAPDLGGVATMFAGAFGALNKMSTAGMTGFTVDGFETMAMGGGAGSMSYNMSGSGAEMLGLLVDTVAGDTATGANAAYTTTCTATAGAACLSYENLPVGFFNTINNVGGDDTTLGAKLLNLGFGTQFDSNLADDKTDGVDDTAFDYMPNATFATFDAFGNAGSQYVYNMPKDSDLDVAFKTKRSTANGVNYSLNASYNYDKNPIIDLSWRGTAGQELTTYEAVVAASGNTTTLQLYDAANPLAVDLIATGAGANVVPTAHLTVANGFYGGAATQAATLRFSQEVKRVANLGGSFDMAIETEALGPVVIRGEALYTKGAYSPVIDKTKLGYGDLVGALEMVKGDRAKFVLGADITAMTNMMISAQFIQDSDLDFVDGANRYTADYATMHMTNGFNKAIKDKNFYSLFFSKPFGASGEHRWNNITMLEEGVNGNGKWNRLDAEFSIDDDTQATVEYNKYWGDANTQFGQLEKSSNIQVGVKYSF